MTRSIDAFVTPSVMKWAREKAKLDYLSAATKLKVPEVTIRGWEDGSIRPTIAQARNAATVYKRSLAVFFLSSPPEDFETLRDFRQLKSGQLREYSPELALAVRLVGYRQQWLKEWLAAEGNQPLAFVGSATLATPPSIVAESIRRILNISNQEQLSCKNREDSLRLWIEKAEQIGICVCRDGSLGLEEVRGFVTVDKYAPFIYINSSDARVGQLFTLAHELAHIWINCSGISNLGLAEPRHPSAENTVEVFCNRVASLTLCSEEAFTSLLAKTASESSLEERIGAISSAIKISEEAVARRLLDMGSITDDDYRRLRLFFIERWKRVVEAKREEQKQRMKEKKQGPSPHLLKVLKNSKILTRTVLTSYYNGILSGSEASHLLDAKINHFPRLAEFARAGSPQMFQFGDAT